eukprot:3098714-Rhodomonas_salina.2
MPGLPRWQRGAGEEVVGGDSMKYVLFQQCLTATCTEVDVCGAVAQGPGSDFRSSGMGLSPLETYNGCRTKLCRGRDDECI